MYKVKKYLPFIFLLTSLLIAGYWININQSTSNNIVAKSDSGAFPTEDLTKFGFDQTENVFEDYRIKRNAFMGDILMSFGVDFDKILKLEKKAENVHSLRRIRAGKDITLVKKDSCSLPHSFVYQPNSLEYIRYDFGSKDHKIEDVTVAAHKVPYDVCIETASGVIEESLWISMKDLGLSGALIDKMEDAISQVDFGNTHVGEQFKLVYERIYVDGEPIRTGKIHSAVYKAKDTEFFGFYFENDKYDGYYNYEGTPNKRTFLKAPVKASFRISSPFNRNRFHPVLKRRKAHLGTDYAAPHGSPIIAVADGVVTHRSYTKGNGKYVKIKHDDTYTTQYLHMSRYQSGVSPGTRVKRGEIIGYVGSTGLATGPHVCFRFWKNGRQIDHTKENFPPVDPMAKTELPEFYETRDILKKELDKIDYIDQKVAYAGYAD